MNKEAQYWSDKFEDFLKENRCFERFEKNLDYISNGLFTSVPQLVESVMDTYNPTGFVIFGYKKNSKYIDFWNDLNNRWIEKCIHDS